MKNIYDGTVTKDGSGHAMVTLPDWFEALNRDFRYQLTVHSNARSAGEYLSEISSSAAASQDGVHIDTIVGQSV